MKLSKLAAFYDDVLALDRFGVDASNNGLQYEGAAEVKRVAFAVDASLASFEAAAAAGADLLFVHHGLSWGAEPRRLTGIVARRFDALSRHRLSLYAAHLPLDAHPVHGNNAVLARLADLQKLRACCDYHGIEIGFAGKLPRPLPAAELAASFETALDCHATVLEGGKTPIRQVAVVSGGGGLEALAAATAEQAEALVTGELTHTMYHYALESGVTVIALGHYASETVGVQSMLALTRETFKLDCRFINLPTGW